MITSSAKSSLLTVVVIIRDDDVVSIPSMRNVGIARQNAMVKNAAAVD